MKSNMTEKTIMATFYDPNNSFFKSKSTERYSYKVYTCCNCENCDAYKRSCCVMRNGLWGYWCPYGKRFDEEGVTKRAKSGYRWLNDAKNKYSDVANIYLKDVKFCCRIGDYVFLPLNFLHNYSNPIDDILGIEHEHFVPIDKWNVDLVLKLINYKPEAMFGGVIKSYQQKEIPKFVLSLKRYFPDMYAQVIKKQPELKSKVQEVSYVGKLAKVRTLLPSKVNLNITGSNSGYWDGNKITTTAKSFFLSALGNDTEVVINPTDESYVYIAEEESVTDETEFKDE